MLVCGGLSVATPADSSSHERLQAATLHLLPAPCTWSSMLCRALTAAGEMGPQWCSPSIPDCTPRYNYETTISASTNSSTASFPCSQDPGQLTELEAQQQYSRIAGCEHDGGSLMWVAVLLGKMLRGVGEASITPLGISFIDDFASPENSAFYIGCLHTFSLIGPLFGFTLGAFCARLYVDIGFVDLGSIAISMKDSRWVNAWWLGFIIAGGTSLLSAFPFFFLPKTLPKEEGSEKDSSTTAEQNLLQGNQQTNTTDEHPKLIDIVKGTFYIFTLCICVTSMPSVSLGIFFSGLIMKKFKLDLLGAVKVGLGTAVLGCLCILSLFALTYHNAEIAGLTVSYAGTGISDLESRVSVACNSGCTFYACRCIEAFPKPGSGNFSALLGQCPREDKCSRMLIYYLAFQSLSFFVFSLGNIPLYIISIRCVDPDLKSLSVGIFTMALRLLFIGLILGLRLLGCIFLGFVIIQMKKFTRDHRKTSTEVKVFLKQDMRNSVLPEQKPTGLSEKEVETSA
ncbi:SO1C1 protein, partial [Polyodon spathula]|nr:SO1C1 protein [Polyodon spathula]